VYVCVSESESVNKCLLLYFFYENSKSIKLKVTDYINMKVVTRIFDLQKKYSLNVTYSA